MTASIPFVSWTEVDPNSKLSNTSARATWTNMVRDELCYLYYGITIPEEFTHKLTFRVTSIDVNTSITSYPLLYIWAVTAAYPIDFCAGNPTAIGLGVLEKGSSTTLFKLFLTNGDCAVDNSSVDLNVGTTYYLTINKTGAIVNVLFILMHFEQLS